MSNPPKLKVTIIVIINEESEIEKLYNYVNNIFDKFVDFNYIIINRTDCNIDKKIGAKIILSDEIPDVREYIEGFFMIADLDYVWEINIYCMCLNLSKNKNWNYSYFIGQNGICIALYKYDSKDCFDYSNEIMFKKLCNDHRFGGYVL